MGVCKVPWGEKHQQPWSVPCNGCLPTWVEEAEVPAVGSVPSTIFTRFYNKDLQQGLPLVEKLSVISSTVKNPGSH